MGYRWRDVYFLCLGWGWRVGSRLGHLLGWFGRSDDNMLSTLRRSQNVVGGLADELVSITIEWFDVVRDLVATVSSDM